MQKLGDAFTYQFKDSDWVTKALLGSLFVFLSFFIIPIPFLIGYMIRNVKNVIDNKPNPMPEWQDLGDMYMQGLKYLLATLGYAIPILLIFFFILMMMIMGFFIGDSEFALIPMLIIFPMQGLIGVYSILMALIAPVLYIKMAKGEPYRNLYDFKTIFKFIKNNFGHLLIVLVLSWAAGMIVNIGMLALFIGILPATYYVTTIMGYLYGQLALQEKK